MNRRHLQLSPAAILLLLLLILAACGPAGESADPPGAQGQSEEPSEGASSDEQESASEAASNGPHFEVAEGSEVVTADGLPAGFTSTGHAFIGNPDAAVLMEEYSDFQCPYCSRFYEQTLPAIMQNQIANGEVVLVYYDFPLTSIHPQAFAASHAARCAAEEGAIAYWDMHDRLFENIGNWSGQADTTSLFAAYAVEIGLDEDGFVACMDSNRHDEAIQADIEDGIERGVSSTPSFFLNDSLLAGAQPLTVFNQAISAVLAGESLATNTQPTQTQQAAPTPAVISDEFAAEMGSPDAPITLVEYTDYQCPYCGRHVTDTMPDIISNFIETGRIRYILKDFPLDSIHPDARSAAAAARCAGEQESYWEMHDELFARQEAWAGLGEQAASAYVEIAEELGLNTRDFNTCLESGRHDAAVEANLQEGLQLGITGTPSFFIEGYPIRGAQPYDLFEYAIELAEDGSLAAAYEPTEQQQAQAQPTPAGPVDVPIDNAVFALGDSDAPVVIVEYTDFQCPYCTRHFQQTLPQIISDYVESGKVFYVFKDFPLTSIHPQAVAAAEAARCADAQEAYLEMHDLLFARQGEWSGMSNAVEVFVGFAAEIGLDTEEFATCMETNQFRDAVMADLEEGSRLGVRGTPAFFLNGLPLSGAQPFAVFEQAFNQLIAAAESQ